MADSQGSASTSRRPSLAQRQSKSSDPSPETLVLEPEAFDVILGRGRSHQFHPGNMRYQGKCIQTAFLLFFFRLMIVQLLALLPRLILPTFCLLAFDHVRFFQRSSPRPTIDISMLNSTTKRRFLHRSSKLLCKKDASSRNTARIAGLPSLQRRHGSNVRTRSSTTTDALLRWRPRLCLEANQTRMSFPRARQRKRTTVTTPTLKSQSPFDGNRAVSTA